MALTVELKGSATCRAEIFEGCAATAGGSLEKFALKEGFVISRLRNLKYGNIKARPDMPEVIRMNQVANCDMSAWNN